jgi:hypothetical protein
MRYILSIIIIVILLLILYKINNNNIEHFSLVKSKDLVGKTFANNSKYEKIDNKYVEKCFDKEKKRKNGICINEAGTLIDPKFLTKVSLNGWKIGYNKEAGLSKLGEPAFYETLDDALTNCTDTCVGVEYFPNSANLINNYNTIFYEKVNYDPENKKVVTQLNKNSIFFVRNNDITQSKNFNYNNAISIYNEEVKKIENSNKIIIGKKKNNSHTLILSIMVKGSFVISYGTEKYNNGIPDQSDWVSSGTLNTNENHLNIYIYLDDPLDGIRQGSVYKDSKKIFIDVDVKSNVGGFCGIYNLDGNKIGFLNSSMFRFCGKHINNKIISYGYFGCVMKSIFKNFDRWGYYDLTPLQNITNLDEAWVELNKRTDAMYNMVGFTDNKYYIFNDSSQISQSFLTGSTKECIESDRIQMYSRQSQILNIKDKNIITQRRYPNVTFDTDLTPPWIWTNIKAGNDDVGANKGKFRFLFHTYSNVLIDMRNLKT